MEPSRRALRIGGGLLVVGLWLQFALSLPAVHEVRLNDFPAYWGAGKMVLEGQPERIYSVEWKWFTNLPVVAVGLAPLACFEYDTAWEILWWSISCLMTRKTCARSTNTGALASQTKKSGPGSAVPG